MAKIKKGTFEAVPEGQHNARLVRIIDFGTQTIAFKDKKTGKPKSFDQAQLQFGFQAVDERKANGDAMMAYETYPNSDSPNSKLIKMIKGWLGLKELPEDFDLDSLLNKEAIITVAHNDAGYASIVNVGGITKGMKVAKATEPVVSNYLDETFDEDVFENECSDFEKGKIMESAEYPELTKPKPAVATKKGKK